MSEGDGPKDVDIGPRDDMVAAAESLKRQLPAFIEHAKLVASVKRAMFVALVEEGFTEEQALRLIKTGMML